MTLTNYWLPLIWLFIGGAILNMLPKRREQLNGASVERWNVLPAILMVLPYIIWAGFRGNIADTWLYRIGYLNTEPDLSAIPAVLTDPDGEDVGYEAFTILMQCLIGDNADLFFLIIAAIQALCMALAFRRYSSNYWISLFLFAASTDYISWMMNGMRQFIAVAVIFSCFGWLVRRKFLPLILVVLAISSFHQSALLMIPIIFLVQGEAWNLKTILMLIATMVIVAFIDRFTPILNDMLQNTNYDTALSDKVLSQDDGTNALRVLVYSVPALLSLVGLRYVRAANDPVINISVNCSIVTMALYLVSMVTSGIYIGRLPIYTTLQGYIALPWLIDHIFEKRSAKLVTCAMVLLFCGFYYYQMFIAWNYG